MKVLICTIARDVSESLDVWYFQISSLVEENKDIDFSISIYENDSEDGSDFKLESFNYDIFKEKWISTEKIGTELFGSVISAQRVINLSNARNKTLDQVEDLSIYDKVVFIEPDITYDTREVSKLIRQQENYGKEFDILSGISVRGEYNEFYDSWCTRINEQDKSLKNLNLGSKLVDCWTTFNCFCVYNAKAFSEGVRFSGIRNEETQDCDCDTALVCENFRKAGYNKIAMDTETVIRHDRVKL